MSKLAKSAVNNSTELDLAKVNEIEWTRTEPKSMNCFLPIIASESKSH